MEIKLKMVMVTGQRRKCQAPSLRKLSGRYCRPGAGILNSGSGSATCQPVSLGKLQTRLWRESPRALPALTLSLNQAHHLALAVIHLSPPGATLPPASQKHEAGVLERVGFVYFM